MRNVARRHEFEVERERPGRSPAAFSPNYDPIGASAISIARRRSSRSNNVCAR
jgi:hypothetical protein